MEMRGYLLHRTYGCSQQVLGHVIPTVRQRSIAAGSDWFS